MKRLWRSLPDIVLGIIFGAVITLLVVELLLRNIVGSSLDWYDEISRVLFTWSVFLGAAIGVREQNHYSVTLFTQLLSARGRHICKLIADVLVAVCAVMLLRLSIALVGIEKNEHLSVTGISSAWVDASFAIGAALMVMYAVGNVVTNLRHTSSTARTAEPDI